MTKRNSDDLSLEMDCNQNSAEIQIQNGLQSVDTNNTNINNNNNLNENNNEITKKVKLESNESTNTTNQRQPTTVTTTTTSNPSTTVKSRVVHVRNIPVDTTDADLIGLSMTFGRVTNCLILRGKSQAFVEFSDCHSAQQMVNYWLQTTVSGIATQLQPTIR
jgi:hypothetical protein